MPGLSKIPICKMRVLITNIKQLCNIEGDDDVEYKRVARGADMAQMPCVSGAWLIVENGLIHSFGAMADLPQQHADETVDASGRLVLPAWVDSHTHLVFAASRDGEFVDRIRGLSYEDIAQRGGGILNSAARLNAMDGAELYDLSLERLYGVMATGTGAIEIKSGYGLNPGGS